MSPVRISSPQDGLSPAYRTGRRAPGRAVSNGLSIRLHNTLTQQVDALKPLAKGKIGLYTCGPTVYDHAHIGNLRTYIFEDSLRRMLRANDYSVKHVMNITDIEDKIFARAKEKGQSHTELTRHYEKIFFEDVERLGIDLGDSSIIRATEAITDMQNLIKAIPNKYITDDGIYFDINKYPDYGVFGKLDRSHEHHRIDNDEYDKDHVADFALWKVGKEGEPSWDFELDGKNIAGRPGWHIECSAMSTKYLGQPFDIHTGGVDLKFPHHENEIAQSKAATGKDLATMFVHGEHLLVEGKKMSKSLKNFYTLEDVTKKGFDPLAFRLLLLQSHYRSQLNFTWEALEAAQSFLQRLRQFADLALQPVASTTTLTPEAVAATKDNMLQAINDDLATPSALATLATIADSVMVVDNSGASSLSDLLVYSDALLGLKLSERSDVTAAQKSMLSDRQQAKDKANFKQADQLRNELTEQGIGLNDTPQGTVWFRIKD